MELVLSMSTGLSIGQGGENRALEKRRAWDRDRKARQREAERLSALSTGLPPDSTGLPVENADVCSDEEEKNRSLQRKGKTVNKKGSRLLSGARVSDENRAIAIENGCPPDRVDAAWTEFVDYWSDIPGQKGCKLSWTGTWRNRVKFIFQRTGNGNGKAQDNPRAGSLIGALDRAIAKAEFEENLGLEVPADNLLRIPGRSIQRS
jgi:hypothetical protein